MKVFACRCYLRETAFPWLQVAVYACDFNSAIVRAVEQCRKLLNYEGQIYGISCSEVPSPTLRDIHDASASLMPWRPLEDGQRMFPRKELQEAYTREQAQLHLGSLGQGAGRDGQPLADRPACPMAGAL